MNHLIAEMPNEAKNVLLFLGGIGAYRSINFIGGLLGGIWKHVLRPSYDLRKRYEAPNKESWAVVTGAAMGIGKHYGLELAKKGFNIVMIDKDENETEKTRREIVQSGVKVKTIIWDLGDLGDAERYEGFEKVLTETTKGLDVCILINNAAEFQQDSLIQIPTSRLFRASNVNSHAPALIARFFIPKMLEKHRNGQRSAIINVGTNAAEIQNPRYQFAVYGASKAYLHILSSGMQECWADKIDVMTAIPRQTKTDMCPVNFCFTTTPKNHVRAVLTQLGYEKQTYGTFMHDLEYQMRFNIPFGFVFDQLIQMLNKKENQKLVQLYDKKIH